MHIPSNYLKRMKQHVLLRVRLEETKRHNKHRGTASGGREAKGGTSTTDRKSRLFKFMR